MPKRKPLMPVRDAPPVPGKKKKKKFNVRKRIPKDAPAVTKSKAEKKKRIQGKVRALGKRQIAKKKDKESLAPDPEASSDDEDIHDLTHPGEPADSKYASVAPFMKFGYSHPALSEMDHYKMAVSRHAISSRKFSAYAEHHDDSYAPAPMPTGGFEGWKAEVAGVDKRQATAEKRRATKAKRDEDLMSGFYPTGEADVDKVLSGGHSYLDPKKIVRYGKKHGKNPHQLTRSFLDWKGKRAMSNTNWGAYVKSLK